MADETTIQELATEALGWFETKKRDDGSEFVGTKADRPEWVQELCHHAHGDMMPDDWRYQFILEALNALANDPDETDMEPDIYTSDLTQWLSSRADRFGYCDDALEEFGADCGGTINLLQMGQRQEKEEVLQLVRESLEERLADQEDDESDD